MDGAQLQSIDANLMWEFGPALHGAGNRPVITPESAYYLTPLVQAILTRAPAIGGWEFYPYRVPEDLDTAEQTVNARTGGTLRDLQVAVSLGDQHLIDLDFVSPSPTVEHDAFVATESLLGEDMLNTWIGAISATQPRRSVISGLRRGGANTEDLMPVSDLRDRVEQTRDAVLAQLPQRPHMLFTNDTDWSLFELSPTEADDYAVKADLLTATTANAELWMAAGTSRFDSIRFSRCGETFCYVKVDGAQGLAESEFTARSSIEDALDEALRSRQLGCVIGAGTGLRYSYVDLALTDLDVGLAAVRERLQAGRLPQRTWVQFFDRVWAHEWVGVHDHTPEPPLA